MTNYGAIPSSSSPEYITRAKDRIKSGLATARPWREMFNLHSFNFPKSFSDIISRFKTNLAYFRMNYAIVVLVILLLSLLWHPISLIVFIAMVALWLFLYFLRDEPLVIFRRTIDDRVVLVVLAVVTVGALMLTRGKVSAAIGVGVGVVVVVVHAMIRKVDDVCVDEEAAGERLIG